MLGWGGRETIVCLYFWFKCFSLSELGRPKIALPWRCERFTKFSAVLCLPLFGEILPLLERVFLAGQAWSLPENAARESGPGSVADETPSDGDTYANF